MGSRLDERGRPRPRSLTRSTESLAITAYPNGIIFQEPPIESPGAWPRDSFAVEELGAKLPQAIRLLEPNATAAMQALGFTSHEMLPLMTRIRHTLATTRQETPR